MFNTYTAIITINDKDAFEPLIMALRYNDVYRIQWLSEKDNRIKLWSNEKNKLKRAIDNINVYN